MKLKEYIEYLEEEVAKLKQLDQNLDVLIKMDCDRYSDYYNFLNESLATLDSNEIRTEFTNTKCIVAECELISNTNSLYVLPHNIAIKNLNDRKLPIKIKNFREVVCVNLGG